MKNESCDKQNLSDFTKGWLVGDFEPSIFKNKDCEVGVKEYKAGTVEKLHVHNIVTEYTIILSGTVIMLEKEFNKGDIVKIEPGVANQFESLTDSMLLVLKTPSLPYDKVEL
jgi:quercetin dioxygenase-like cupin family protein